jgi:hypothetical protein
VQKYEEDYRQGHIEPTDKTYKFDETKTTTKTNTDLTAGTDKKFSPSQIHDQEKEKLVYHGIEYKEICEAWQTAQG